tara:strand:+ start:173 stop:343 length:171 start_codon:yes stop_codon:yes gene_type:complete
VLLGQNLQGSKYEETSGQPNQGTNSGNTNQITAPKIKPAQQDAIITIEDFFMTAKR